MNVRARSVLTTTIGAAIAILAVVAPAPRGAAATSPCRADVGVTVIVDFTHFGRAIERGCASGDPANALAALHTAGFRTAGTTQYGDAFLCRIDALPSPKTEGCAVTPPAKASWSFYTAHRTDSAWTYSRAGVLSYQPPPGTIMAFAFGYFAKPGISPSAAIAAPTTTTATPRTLPTSTVAPTRPPVTEQAYPPATTAPPPTLPTPPTATTAPPAASSASMPVTTVARPPRTPTKAPTSTSAPPLVVDRTAGAAVPRDSSGSPFPALFTIALVAVLGVGAGAMIRARRRGVT